METQHTEEHLKPSQIDHAHWIFMNIVGQGHKPDILGKWLVFKHYDEIDETWGKIQTAMVNNDLQGCVEAKCSTKRYNPTKGGPGPAKAGVISVYTEEHDMDAIGMKLINIVKHDIKYKTDTVTLDSQYTHTGARDVCLKCIYWNRGKPSFECKDRPFHSTNYKREDIWRLNVVEASKPISSETIHGRWVMSLENEELTELWHQLKKLIESETENFGMIKMVCPPKRNRKSPDEMPVFHVYTSEDKKVTVGKRLINIIQRDMHYESSLHGRPNMKMFFWNDGEPDYKKVTH